MATLARHGIGYREIEQATGIPSTTARRYARRFATFLPCRVVDRAARFPAESVETFKRIHALFVEGKRTEEVAAILAGELPQVHEISTPATDAATVATAGDPAGLVAVVPLLERLTVAVEALAAAQAETVALLREARERPPDCPVEATEAKSQGDARQEEKTARKRPLWRSLLGRWGK